MIEKISIVLFLVLLLKIIVGNRSFWLDESFIVQILKNSSLLDIFSGNPLPFGQAFPRVYLGVLYVIGNIFDYSTFWLRIPSFMFGIFGLFLWRLILCKSFKEYRLSNVYFAIAMVLLLWNGFSLYYCYELKPYSADLFFPALIFNEYLKEKTGELNNAKLFGAIIVGCLFSYGAIFISFIILFLELIAVNKIEELKAKMPWMLLFMLSIGFVFHFEFSQSIASHKGSALHSYWSAYMAQGTSFVDRLSDTIGLLKKSIVFWWRTDYGMLNETILPYRSVWIKWEGFWASPDIRNIALCVSLYVVGLAFYHKRVKDIRIYCVTVSLFIFCGFLAYLNLYPLGSIRVSLYLLPFSIVFLVRPAATMLEEIASGKLMRIWATFVLFSLFFLGLRCFVVVSNVVAAGSLPENIYSALKAGGVKEGDIVFYSPVSELMINSLPQKEKLANFRPLKEFSTFSTRTENESAYVLWVHHFDEESKKLLFELETSKRASVVYSPPKDVRIEMYKIQ